MNYHKTIIRVESSKDRIHIIDTLRGIALLGVILIHSAGMYLSDNVAYMISTWMQFVVPLFIFCSTYIYFQRNLHKVTSILSIRSYINKRFIRLIGPYYMYLSFYILLLYFFDPASINIQYFLPLVTLSSPDNDTSWIILLFLYLSVLLPIIEILFQKSNKWLTGLIIISFSSSVYFLFFSSPIHFKVIMWLPWLLHVLLTRYFVHNKDNIQFIVNLILIFFVIFLISLTLNINMGNSLNLYDNKYPPNIYYISYGVITCFSLYLLFNRYSLNNTLNNLLIYIGRNSYSIYFIHTLFLFIVGKLNYISKLHWWSLFSITVIISLIVEKYIIIHVSSLLKGKLITYSKKIF